MQTRSLPDLDKRKPCRYQPLPLPVNTHSGTWQLP